MRTMEEERDAFLDHIENLIGYWSSDIPLSNVPAETPKRDALEGLAFSILVALDGGAAVGPYAVRAIDENGKVGPDIAGGLHDRPSRLGRKPSDSEKRQRLARLEAELDAAGGRGVELADEIDELRGELEHNSGIPETKGES